MWFCIIVRVIARVYDDPRKPGFSLIRGTKRPATAMYYTQCLLPVVLPVIFWAAYHYHKDHQLPEPAGHLAFAFLLGIAAFFLGLVFYAALDLVGLRFDAYLLAESNLAGLLAYCLFVIGPFEELAKLVPFLLLVLRFKEFDEPIDGIIYASFIALGFGTIENFYYLQYLSGVEAWGRAFAGPLLHIVFASIWGYYIGRAYLCGKSLLRITVLAFAASAIVHGLYDFLVLGMEPELLPIPAAIITGIWIWRLMRIRDLHALPPGPCPEPE